MAKNYTQQQVLAVVQKSGGVVSVAAAKLNCSWSCANTYIQKWKATREAFDAQREKLHATAYNAFLKAIQDGERWAIERVLDTTAAANGHTQVQKIEQKIEHSGEVAQTINIVKYDDGRD